MAAIQARQRIPVTVITGSPGSGKTTLLDHILSRQHGRKVAAILNEFGEVGIDGQLILQEDDQQLIEIDNGGVCCKVRGDLAETIGKLQERADDIFRSMGVFNARSFDERVIFQSVRMLTTMSRFTSWESDAARRSEYVAIGRNLDRVELEAGFSRCVAN